MNLQRFKQCIHISTLALTAFSSIAYAEKPADRKNIYDIANQDLSSALRQVGKQSGREIIAPSEALDGKIAPTLQGTFSADEAIKFLLRGSGLVAEFRDDIVLIRGRETPSGEVASRQTGNDTAIIVTGSRIRGASIASPVTVRTRRDMQEAGQYSFGDVIRSIPQNFNGGQGPTIASGAENFGSSNVNSGTALNLRGLGQDATLTLVNGKRLAYNSIRQAVDITEIPIAAVERLEIVADGASALYGSDAVGGVANVILRKDYDGLTTTARFGAATEGGYVQKQLTAVAGQTWANGGFIITGDLANSGAILARQRAYTQGFDGSYTLYPDMQYRGAVLSGHQQISSNITANFDALYSVRRSNDMQYPLNPETSATFYGYINDQRTRSYTLSPGLALTIGSDWKATVNGVYGNELSSGYSEFYLDGEQNYASISRFKNSTKVVEVGAEGPLMTLPGGAIGLAAGGGYRRLDLDQLTQTVGFAPTISLASQDSYAVYGELFVPLVSQSMDIEGFNSLSFSGAVRHEKYNGLKTVTTPKAGIVYAPIDGIELKASWGKSFKTPALFQLFRDQPAVLAPMSLLTTGYPASANFLYLYGGNRSLRPEKATTWTTTAKWSPKFLEGSYLEISYFHIAYRDRVAEPFRLSQAFLPEYAEYITYAPTNAEMDAAIARSAAGLINYSDAAFDPAQVVALIDDRYVNATSQTIQGIDGSFQLHFARTDYGSIDLTGSVTYLRSRQKLAPGQDAVPLAGTIYRPPHWRANMGAVWRNGDLALGTFVNYIGSVKDNISTPILKVDDQATVDFSATYAIPKDGTALGNIEASLAISNFLNDAPARLRPYSFGVAPYDSVNQSPLGRTISLTIAKHW
ncbi:TonB-dependent receptor [Sphingobium phenoxybenzoativorans]|uniref:TonB-dependent receptor n=1 Tax=Sphingobium phenoxybenzoativorans TaxID=1592790 RepID=A0A975K8W6_9SPHN|nr:TonB-dependent receptor [Sphingobium phenoxybenzoativorans]QUT05602.1 TonB-dependent receptor [Sphingobium phenoxybenzoativorans]